MNLNWDAIGALGEIVGAAAVLATLVYLSAQIRSARIDQQTNMRNEAFRQMQEFSYYVMSDQSLAWAFHQGSADPATLNPEQQAQFWQAAFAFLKLNENIYLHYLKGAVDEESWNGLHAILDAYITRPGMARYWKERRLVFDPKFGQILDAAEPQIKSGAQILNFSGVDEISPSRPRAERGPRPNHSGILLQDHNADPEREPPGECFRASQPTTSEAIPC